MSTCYRARRVPTKGEEPARKLESLLPEPGAAGPRTLFGPLRCSHPSQTGAAPLTCSRILSGLLLPPRGVSTREALSKWRGQRGQRWPSWLFGTISAGRRMMGLWKLAARDDMRTRSEDTPPLRGVMVCEVKTRRRCAACAKCAACKSGRIDPGCCAARRPLLRPGVCRVIRACERQST